MKNATLLLLFSLALPAAIFARQPVDANATPQTKRLHARLQQLLHKGIMFGHQDDLAYGVQWKYQPGKSDVKEVTGDYPAVYGWELGKLEHGAAQNLDSVPFDRMKAFIREGYERGGIITISWHLDNPLTGQSAWHPAPGTVEAILPGGEKHALYKSWLNRLAAFFQSLKGQRGEAIPVIFRPFHELNGDWFWWGGKHCSPRQFKELWRFTVSYLRDVKQVHQLLYAYNTDRFASETAYLEKYPGNEWVDIIGFDIYQGNRSAAAFGQELDHTLGLLTGIARKLDKIPALTEFGCNGLAHSSWWTQVFLPAIAPHRISYVLAWRNAGYKPDGSTEFYVPYKGQASAADFVRFFRDGRILFGAGVARERLYE